MKVTKLFGTLARPFEQYAIGQQFITRRRTIFESDLTSFIHSTGYSGEDLFGDSTLNHSIANKESKRLVPALLTMSLADGLIVGSGVLEGYAIGLVGITDMKAVAPVYAGDTIFVEFEVTETKASKSKPDRGIVTTIQHIKNQNNDLVLNYKVSRMLKRSSHSKL